MIFTIGMVTNGFVTYDNASKIPLDLLMKYAKWTDRICKERAKGLT